MAIDHRWVVKITDYEGVLDVECCKSYREALDYPTVEGQTKTITLVRSVYTLDNGVIDRQTAKVEYGFLPTHFTREDGSEGHPVPYQSTLDVRAYSPESKVLKKLEPGDEVFIGSVKGRGGHGAYIVIDKMNKKSIMGTERERSYTPGTKWRIGPGIEIALVGTSEDGRMTTAWGVLNHKQEIVR